MLMGFPADMAVVLLEKKARDAYAVLEAVAVRGKKALAERVAAAKTVGTRRERASISHTDGRTLAPRLDGGGWMLCACEVAWLAGWVSFLSVGRVITFYCVEKAPRPPRPSGEQTHEEVTSSMNEAKCRAR